MGTITVVGLGPAGADHLLPVARRALERAAVRFVRTARHPAVDDLVAEGLALESFDAAYESSPDHDAVYAEIVRRLVAAVDAAGAAGGDVVYAVPGNPAVAERTVELLRAVPGLEVQVVAGLSFADLAWTRLGVDPMGDGAVVVDAQDLERLGPAPTLVGHVVDRLRLSDVKLTLLEHLPPEAPVVVLQRLGRPDEGVTTVALAELDHGVEPDHLTSVFVDGRAGLGPEPAAALGRFLALVERLRGPGGCPWDAEQTHHSLTRHLVEEAYEVVEAIDGLPAGAPMDVTGVEPGAYDRLCDELGDLLFQVFFHATLAAETGAFTMAEVADGIHDKLVRRHPHVFGDVAVTDANHVTRNWEQIKRAEKAPGGAGATGSLMDEVPRALPSLLYAHKLFRKAASGGLTWDGRSDATSDAAAGVAGGAAALVGPGVTPERVGAALAALVHASREAGFDAESAMRSWADGFRRRFQALERAAVARGTTVEHLDADERARLWAATADA
jgi:tetrapyrrole methylase family protein/MazG family protein